jgi:nitroimidazol reductase NimA-like FMN-containing flavoprotein (pyridoxamine 5'-phosphate oxidase superfamily)
MDETQSIAMGEDERDDFLGTGGTGVISFAESESEFPHSLPVSYGYDADETTFYFRLAVASDSNKGDVTGRSVTFVTYGQTEDRWRSVIVKGHLRETTEQAIATESLEGLGRVQIPLVDIFGRPIKEVPFEFYRLAPEEITSRKESSTEI